MEDILKAIRKDLKYKNYYSVLFLTVMLTSICSALESSNGEDNSTKYKAWYSKYVGDLFLKGDECYKLRCALLHRGKTNHKNSSFNGFRFTFPSKKITLHNNNFGGALNLDITLFCERILQGVEVWLQDMKSNTNYQRNIKDIIRYHKDSFAGFISGMKISSIY